MSRSRWMRPSFVWPVGALLIGVPVLNGCGGGSSGVVVPTATPVPTATTAPSPTPTTAAPLLRAPVDLGNGQNGELRIISVNNNQLLGSLIVNPPTPQPAKDGAKSFTFILPSGTYNFGGTLTPPRTYRVAGTGPNNFRFTINGLLPTTSQTGTYTIAANNQTVSGTLPVLTQPLPF